MWAVTLGSLFIWLEIEGILGITLKVLASQATHSNNMPKNYELCTSARWSVGAFWSSLSDESLGCLRIRSFPSSVLGPSMVIPLEVFVPFSGLAI